MKKIKELINIFKNSDQRGIYGHILRVALWGSLVTFSLMVIISSICAFILHNIIIDKGKELSEKVGDHVEIAVSDESKDHLTEMAILKAQIVNRILKNCAINVEFLSDKMSDILKNSEDHKPSALPIANYEEIPDYTPYLFYTNDILQKGITPELSKEISLASSINNDMKRIKRHYYTVMIIASKHGYMIRMDMIAENADDDVMSVLSKEPLRNNYNFLNLSWYKNEEKEQKLIFTNPYIASHGAPCISITAPYYDNNGFAGVVLVDIDTKYMEDRIANINDHEKDFTFIMGKNGEILVSSVKEGMFSVNDMITDLRKSDNESIANLANDMTEGKTGIAKVSADNTEYYIAYAPVKNSAWSLGTLIDKKEITKLAERLEDYVNKSIDNYNNDLNKFFALIAIISLISFMAILCLIIRKNTKIAQGIASPIQLLTEGTQEIAKGNLNKKLNIKTGDEVEILSDNFNKMTDELTLYIKNLEETTANEERIKTELGVATNIQVGMLPTIGEEIKNRKEFDLSAIMHPAREVGGDFYDFYLLDENHLVITVADVSDKGIPASLFMAISKATLKGTMLFGKTEEKLGQVFEKTNDALIEMNPMNMFVTVFTGILNLKTGEVIYANAGHNPPIIITKGTASYLPKALNPIMGVLDGLKFKTAKITLEKGDSLLLYTDGVTEARFGENDMFGEERLLKVAKTLGKNAEVDIESIYKSVQEYVKDTPQSDDITILEVIYKGNTNIRKD